MRYTSESTMDDRALRDVERWKDKIEVRLDNRQVFFLFFGSALVACLLFILGVIVGKRLESRGKAAAPEIEDPLALLDKVASSPRTGPEPPASLPKVLFGASQPAAKPAPPPAAKPVAPPPAKPVVAKPVASVPKPVASGPKPVAVATPAVAPPKPSVATQKPVTPKADPKAEAAVAASKPTAVTPPIKKLAAAAAAPPAAAAATAKGRFTLQLGSFPDRAEAEAFSQRFSGQGSYVVASDIPNKGTWYRVRVGDFASAKDAIDAKSAFEKQHNVIAYVVGPR